MITIVRGMTIAPVDTLTDLIKLGMRVLYANKQQDTLIAITTDPKTSNAKLYFTAPKKYNYSHISTLIESCNLKLLKEGTQPPPDVLASDESLNNKYGANPCKAVQKRHERFKIIQSLVGNDNDYFLLYQSETRESLIKHYLIATLKSDSESEKRKIQQYVYQFLALGETRNALTPFHAAKGGRGKERTQLKKLGRPNAPTKAGIEGKQGFVMTDIDKKQCGFGFRNYLTRGRTVEKAFELFSQNFYISTEQNEQGNSVPKLLPKNLRPSLQQFKRWGSKLSNKEIWLKDLNKQQQARLNRPILGNANEGIYSVGQVGAIDSTTTDVNHVAVTDRLKRIGFSSRILVVDGLYGLVAGFYMGLEPPSSATVKLAILHAMSDKTEWLKFLKLDHISPDDWLPIRFGNLIADNTDARSENVLSHLNDENMGIKFVPVARSDFNSMVETVHHTLHRTIDHLLPGTTHGKRLERGDENPDISARFTVIEGIRAIADSIHLHNTIPLDIPITQELRKEIIDKGLIVNRLNLTKMAISQGKLHVSLICKHESIIRFATQVRGTFTAKGVKIHRSDTSQKAFIEPIRYISKSPQMLEKFHQARINRRVSPEHYEATFLYNPYQPNCIFYHDLNSGELFKLDLDTPEEDWGEFTIPDFLAAMQQNAIYKNTIDEIKDQQKMEHNLRIENRISISERKYEEAASKSKPLPKSRIAKDKKKNHQQERTISTFNSKTEADSYNETLNPPDSFEKNIDRKYKSNILDGLIKRGGK